MNTSPTDFAVRAAPIDHTSAGILAQQGLRYDTVDTSDPAVFGAWMRADERGFHYPRSTPAELAESLDLYRYRRTTGVWAEGAAVPVATVSSWVTGLTLPGPATLGTWAISSVTVSPTHRRRGIARALLEGELRTARTLGLSLAALTATEATLYGRYGFAPAAAMTALDIERTRVSWNGPATTGRISFVDGAEFFETALGLSNAAAARTPGEVTRWPGLIKEYLGLTDTSSEYTRTIQVAAFYSASGEPEGFVSFRVPRTPPAYGRVEVDHLAATTDEAYRELWRFVVELDFVSHIHAPLRSSEESLPWLLADPRAIKTTESSDHLWVRILDVAAVLSARGYRSREKLVLTVHDELGYAEGRFMLDGATGSCGVLATEERVHDAPHIELSVTALGSLVMGGYSAAMLAQAGLITAHSPESVAVASALFASEKAPHLSIWF